MENASFAHEVFSVPNSRVGLIIGRNGTTVKQLQDLTGARIKVPKDFDPMAESREVQARLPVCVGDVCRQILLSGPPQAIEDMKVGCERSCRRRLRACCCCLLLTAGTQPGDPIPDLARVRTKLLVGGPRHGAAGTDATQIPNDKVGLIIGKGGSTIREIQARAVRAFHQLLTEADGDGLQSHHPRPRRPPDRHARARDHGYVAL